MYTKHTEDRVKDAVSRSVSYAETLKHLGIRDTGGNRQNLKHNIEKYGLATGHFLGQGHNKGRAAVNRRPAQEILICYPEGSRRVSAARLRKALVSIGVAYICTECGGGPEWNGKPLTIEVDHINGNNIDCRPENLRFMCPNCHTQEPTSTSWRFTESGSSRVCACGGPKLSRSKGCSGCYRKRRQGRLQDQ